MMKLVVVTFFLCTLCTMVKARNRFDAGNCRHHCMSQCNNNIKTSVINSRYKICYFSDKKFILSLILSLELHPVSIFKFRLHLRPDGQNIIIRTGIVGNGTEFQNDHECEAF